MLLKNSKRFRNLAFSAFVMILIFSSCEKLKIYDDGVECRAVLALKFVYDYNIKYADAFPHEVKSMNVWAFDSDTGDLVWSEAMSNEMLAETGYVLETPLGDGKYDFVTWCGLPDSPEFTLGSYTPANKEELDVYLTAMQENAGISDREFSGLYHGMEMNVEFRIPKNRHIYKEVTLNVMKDTKNVRVLLQHLDGSPIKEEDFEAKIEARNGYLDWNNDVLENTSPVVYTPWGVKYGVTGSDNGSRAITSISTLLFEMSTSRLMRDRDVYLTITRKTDDTEIIHINLADYFIMVKGHYGVMTDQEYLDRQDDYSIMFFIDENNNWYRAQGIYINSWVVVPPQDENV